VTETITRERFNNDSSTSYGALGTPTSGIGARVLLRRQLLRPRGSTVASVDVGTNGGTAWTNAFKARQVARLPLWWPPMGYAADAVQTSRVGLTDRWDVYAHLWWLHNEQHCLQCQCQHRSDQILAALTSIGSGQCGRDASRGWRLGSTLHGSLAGVYQTQMTATSSLTGGTSPAVSVGNTLARRR